MYQAHNYASGQKHFFGPQQDSNQAPREPWHLPIQALSYVFNVPPDIGLRVGQYGEEQCNTRGQLLRQLMHDVDLYAANGRRATQEPECTYVATAGRSVIDYMLLPPALPSTRVRRDVKHVAQGLNRQMPRFSWCLVRVLLRSEKCFWPDA